MKFKTWLEKVLGESAFSNFTYASSSGKRGIFYHGEEKKHNIIIAGMLQGNAGQARARGSVAQSSGCQSGQVCIPT